jgi:hypothetical protein
MSQDRIASAIEIGKERVTNAQKAITTDHALIHDGNGYSLTGIFAAVANNAVVNYAFKTPTVASGKYIHLKYHEFSATANKIRADLYEAPTAAPTNGSAIVPVNRRRAGTVAASSMQSVKAAMDIVLTGATTLETQQFISEYPRTLDIEFVLKPDTWYIRTLTNSTGGAADINFFEFWYEENNG